MLALLDSAADGERVAALTKASQILHAHGMKWVDVINHLENAGGHSSSGFDDMAAAAVRREAARAAEVARGKEAKLKKLLKEIQADLEKERALTWTLRRQLAGEREHRESLERQIESLAAQVTAFARLGDRHAWREEVERLLAEGTLSCREIARRVKCSPQSVINIRDRLKN